MRFTGCVTLAGAGTAAGVPICFADGCAAIIGTQLPLPSPLVLRRLCHGTTTLTYSSRVPMIEIAIANGMTK